jgi:hypothetical protein
VSVSRQLGLACRRAQRSMSAEYDGVGGVSMASSAGAAWGMRLSEDAYVTSPLRPPPAPPRPPAAAGEGDGGGGIEDSSEDGGRNGAERAAASPAAAASAARPLSGPRREKNISHLSQHRQEKIYAEEAWLFAAFDILIAVTANNLMQQFIQGDGISKKSSFFDFIGLFAPIFHTHWLSQEILRQHTLPKIKFYLAMFVVLLGILISAAGIDQCSSRGEEQERTYCTPYAAGVVCVRLWLALVELYHCVLRYGSLSWGRHELKKAFFLALSALIWSGVFLSDSKLALKWVLGATLAVDWVCLPLLLFVQHTGVLYRAPLGAMWENHTIFMVLIMAEGMVTVTEYYKDREHEAKYWYMAVLNIALMFLGMLLYLDGARAAGHKLLDVKLRRDIFLAALDHCYAAVFGKTRLEYARGLGPAGGRSLAARLADEDLIETQRAAVTRFAAAVRLPVTPVQWGRVADTDTHTDTHTDTDTATRTATRTRTLEEPTWHVYVLKHMHTFLHVVLAVCLLAMAAVVEHYLQGLQGAGQGQGQGHGGELYWKQFYYYAGGFQATLLAERLLMQRIYTVAFTHAAYRQVQTALSQELDAYSGSGGSTISGGSGGGGVKRSKSKRFSSMVSRDLCDHVKPVAYFFDFQFRSSVDGGGGGGGGGERGRKRAVQSVIRSMLDSPRVSVASCLLLCGLFLLLGRLLPPALPADSPHHVLVVNCCFLLQYVALSSRRQHRNVAYHFDEIN